MKKRYGSYQVIVCINCDKAAVTRKKTGTPCCEAHRFSADPEVFCICGKQMEIRLGKYGVYGACLCGYTVNYQKIKDGLS